MNLTAEECELLVKKLEYTFKKKANAELDAKALTECSQGAKLLHRLKEASNVQAIQADKG